MKKGLHRWGRSPASHQGSNPGTSRADPAPSTSTRWVSVGLWLNSMTSVPLSTSTPTFSFSFSRKTTCIPLCSYSRIRAPQFLCFRFFSSPTSLSYLPRSRSTARETRLPAGTTIRTFAPSTLASSRFFSRCDPGSGDTQQPERDADFLILGGQRLEHHREVVPPSRRH